jgi:Transposase zinc-binding domain
MLADAVVTNGCRTTPVATCPCPKCQGVKRAQSLQARLERLLPVEHFHVAARRAISTVFCNERKSTVT